MTEERMIRTILLDDDVHSQKAACAALKNYEELQLTAAFQNSRDFFDYLEGHPAELVFLDIELEGENGFDIAKRLREEYPEMMIVFLTGHSSYAIDGYDFAPVNFLTKPIHPLKLQQTMEEIHRRMEHSQRQQSEAKLMLHMQQGYRIVAVQDICCIERRNRKIYMITAQGEQRIGNYTMRELEEMLEPYGFFCTHQSFLISLYRIEGIRDVGRQLYEAHLRDCAMPVPISRNRYEALRERLQEIGIQAL
jgi:DNA-binding LytR/AlgR family response regulator